MKNTINKIEETHEVVAQVLNNQPEFLKIWNAATEKDRQLFRKIMIETITEAAVVTA